MPELKQGVASGEVLLALPTVMGGPVDLDDDALLLLGQEDVDAVLEIGDLVLLVEGPAKGRGVDLERVDDVLLETGDGGDLAILAKVLAGGGEEMPEVGGGGGPLRLADAVLVNLSIL